MNRAEKGHSWSECQLACKVSDTHSSQKSRCLHPRVHHSVEKSCARNITTWIGEIQGWIYSTLIFATRLPLQTECLFFTQAHCNLSNPDTCGPYDSFTKCYKLVTFVWLWFIKRASISVEQFWSLHHWVHRFSPHYAPKHLGVNIYTCGICLCILVQDD